MDVGEFNGCSVYCGCRLYTALRLDYRLRLWTPTSASRAISAVAELLVSNCQSIKRRRTEPRRQGSAHKISCRWVREQTDTQTHTHRHNTPHRGEVIKRKDKTVAQSYHKRIRRHYVGLLASVVSIDQSKNGYLVPAGPA